MIGIIPKSQRRQALSLLDSGSSSPEIVSAECGALGDTLDELVERRPALDWIAPEACRARVERHFTHHVMAEGYLRMFRHYLAAGSLPAGMLLG